MDLFNVKNHFFEKCKMILCHVRKTTTVVPGLNNCVFSRENKLIMHSLDELATRCDYPHSSRASGQGAAISAARSALQLFLRRDRGGSTMDRKRTVRRTKLLRN